MLSYSGFDGTIDEVLSGWRWLVGEQPYELLLVSLFGDLAMRDASGAICLLDVNMGELVYASEPGDSFESLFPIAFNDAIAQDYRAAGLLPVENTCYGYKEQLVAKGSLLPANVYIADIREYVSFMAKFHFEIRDVEDGETVMIHARRVEPN